MKKFFSWLGQTFHKGTGKIVLDVAVGTGIDKGGELLEQALIDFHKTHPVAAKQLVASLYIFADTSLEDLADKTETKYDDNAIDRVKEEMEQFASAQGIVLTNLDND